MAPNFEHTVNKVPNIIAKRLDNSAAEAYVVIRVLRTCRRNGFAYFHRAANFSTDSCTTEFAWFINFVIITAGIGLVDIAPALVQKETRHRYAGTGLRAIPFWWPNSVNYTDWITHVFQQKSAVGIPKPVRRPHVKRMRCCCEHIIRFIKHKMQADVSCFPIIFWILAAKKIA